MLIKCRACSRANPEKEKAFSLLLYLSQFWLPFLGLSQLLSHGILIIILPREIYNVRESILATRMACSESMVNLRDQVMKKKQEK